MHQCSPPVSILNSMNVYKKVKWSRYRPGLAQRVGIALLFHERGTRSGWVVSNTPRPHFTPGKDPVPIVHPRLGGPQDQSGRSEILVPTGIRSRTVQPVVIRYIDWATRPTHEHTYKLISICEIQHTFVTENQHLQVLSFHCAFFGLY